MLCTNSFGLAQLQLGEDRPFRRISFTLDRKETPLPLRRAIDPHPFVPGVQEELRALGVPVQGGRFGAHMEVELINDGPMTILLDTDLWAC